jgi:alkylhydroperoxidase family enzyme
MGGDIAQKTLADLSSAKLSPKLRAMLGFLEKLTLNPEGVSKEDAEPLKAVGIKKAAATDAIYVAALFCVYNRLADAFGFALPTDNYQMAPKILLSFIGYR